MKVNKRGLHSISTTKQLEVMRGLQQKESGSRFKASQRNTSPQKLYFHRETAGNRQRHRFKKD